MEDEVYVSRANDDDPKVPSYEGGKFPLSTYLASRVRNILADPVAMAALAATGAGMAGNPDVAVGIAWSARIACRNISACNKKLSCLLSVRRPARPPDARHVADAPAPSARACAR